MTFSKLDQGLTRSSLWSESYHVRIVFVSFLSLKDENGFVEGTRSSLSRVCNVSIEHFDEAILKLESPDQESKTTEFEGRRISKVEGGWIVLNHDKYRLPEQEKAENRKNYMKNYMKEYRSVNSVNNGKVNSELTPVNSEFTSVSVSKSVSVSSSEEDSKEKQKTWRDSFEIYLSGCKDMYKHLLNNTPWIVDQERFHPNVDIRLSLEKAFKTFWGTEAGWKHKKSKRTKDIDWKSTFTKAIDMNKVYKPRDYQRQSEQAQTRYREI